MMSKSPNQISIIYPEEKLPLTKNFLGGLQHLFAMFGATTLGPILMGFDPNVSVFFSGVATVLFYFLMKGKIPSYLGSSFAFIAPVIAATSYAGTGPNPNIAIALGGIVAAGLLYALVGLVVMVIGHGFLEKLMPPVVTGVVVGIIGINLAPVAVNQLTDKSFGQTGILFGILTIFLVCLFSVYLPGFWRRTSILLGASVATLLYAVFVNGLGMGPKPISFDAWNNAAWLGLPSFTPAAFDLNATIMIIPVVLVLVAENLGHIKAISVMTGRPMDDQIGKAFLADGLSTALSGSGGGTGVTTYAENMGVMAATKNYSSFTVMTAGIIAVLLGFSPKFGALIAAVPLPVLGGLAFVVFGLITAMAGRIWVDNKVDFSQTRNLLVVGIGMVVGAGNLSFNVGPVVLGGIASATVIAIGLYHILRRGNAHE